MKKFFIIIAITAFTLQLYSQLVSMSNETNMGEFHNYSTGLFFYKAGQYPVNIYSQAEGNSIIAVIQDDTIQEIWSSIVVVSRGDSRFYGHVENNGCIHQLSGWINYEDCGVYLLLSPSFPEEAEDRVIKLYEQPDSVSCSSTILSGEIVDMEVKVLDYLRIGSCRWVKVNCPLKSGKTIIGWTTRYCGDIYGCYGV